MKLEIFLVTAMLLTCLSGCVPAPTAPETTLPTTTPPTTQQTTLPTTVPETTVPETTAAETTAAATRAPEDLTYGITTPWFTLRLPDSWQDTAVIKQQNNIDGDLLMTLRFCEKVSEPTAGGHVFSLWVLKEGADYTYLPQYRFLGMLTDEQGVNYQLIAMYPSDVQFEPEAVAVYTQMAAEEERILQTLTPTPGCTFTPEETQGEEN